MASRARAGIGAGLVGLLVAAATARADLPYEGEPIRYLNAPTTDPVARLQARIDRGEVALERDGQRGYVKAVLDALKVPVESQVLVFSKTSFQRSRIGPEAPRALYFNDETYVGYVRGGDVLEVATTDPKLGAVFYLLPQDEAEHGGSAKFLRQTHDCLQCHSSSRTKEVPGHLVRSVFPDASGQPVFSAGTFATSHDSPFSERWGGWYVSGTHGAQRHMGNAVVADPARPERLDREAGANVTDLSGRFDAGAYLSPHSDLVALMVLEHQATAHNLITHAHYQARLALHAQGEINRALGEKADYVSEGTRRRIERPAEELLRYLLFSEEAALTAPVAGTSGFAASFSARGPRDREGRSLRDFDLKTRLFKYPCSYLIYSEAFDALPEPTRAYLDRRLYDVLTGRDADPAFARLSADDRRAILSILRATKPGLPAYWKDDRAEG